MNYTASTVVLYSLVLSVGVHNVQVRTEVGCSQCSSSHPPPPPPPPTSGHHAGPSGVVPNTLDAIGTHGFCLLNNVAVAAAYVRNVYGRPRASYAAALDWGIPHENHVSADVSASSASEVEVGMPSDSVSAAAAPLSFATSTSVSSGRPTSSHGHTATAGDAAAAAAPTSAPSSVALSQPLIRRVAIFDFDVHHGNGTEAIVRSLVPTEVVTRVSLPFAQGVSSSSIVCSVDPVSSIEMIRGPLLTQ